MNRPASLGGNGPARAQPGSASAEADFIESYQDPQTRQWLCRVQLDGGRVLEGVRFIDPSGRAGVGSRPVRPAKGERGIVLFPSSARQVKLTYWLGSIDHYTFGIDVRHPDESVTVHPSGRAEITDEFGNHAVRYPNGDVIALDDNTTTPEPFYRPKGQKIASRKPFSELDPKEYQRPELLNGPGHSRWKYNGLKGGRFFGAQLQRNEEVPDIGAESWLNRDDFTYKTHTRYADPLRFFESGFQGEALTTHFRVGAAFGTPEDSGSAHLDLQARGGLATLSTLTPRGSTSLTHDADGGTITLEASELVKLIAPLIRLEAERILAGKNASIPVAMSNTVDRNFAKIQILLGLPMEPTASTTLFAEGLL